MKKTMLLIIAMALILSGSVNAATVFLTANNFAESTTSSSVTNVATELDVQSGDGAEFPDSSVDFHIVVGDEDQGYEVMNVTARTSDTMTVVRGQEGSSGTAFSDGTPVFGAITFQYFSDLYTAVNTLEAGNIDHIQLPDDDGSDGQIRYGDDTDVIAGWDNANSWFAMQDTALNDLTRLTDQGTTGLFLCTGDLQASDDVIVGDDLVVTGNRIDDSGGQWITSNGAGSATIAADLVVTGNDVDDSGGNWIDSDGSGNTTLNGFVLSTDYFRVTANTGFVASSGPKFYKQSNLGAAIQAVTGSTHDFVLLTPLGQILLSNPTGTNDFAFLGAGGMVGIGAIPVTDKLEVTGDTTITGNLKLGTGAVNDGRVSYGSDGDVYTHNETADTELDIVASKTRLSGVLEIGGGDIVTTDAGLFDFTTAESFAINADDAGNGGESIKLVLNSQAELNVEENRVTIENDLAVGRDVLFTTDGGGLTYGGISVKDNAVADILNSAAKVQFLDFDTNNPSNATTPDHTNDHITIVNAGDYTVSSSVTIANNAAQSHEVDVSIWINNGATELDNVHAHHSLIGGANSTSTLDLGAGLVTLAASDTVELWMDTDSASDRSVTVSDAVITVIQVGGP